MGKASYARRLRKVGADNKYKKPYVFGGGVELDFSVEEWDELQRFLGAVNSSGGEHLTLERVCKQAVFMTVQRAYQEAHKLAAESKSPVDSSTNQQSGVTDGQSTSTNTAGTSANLLVRQDAGPTVLAEAPPSGTETTTG